MQAVRKIAASPIARKLAATMVVSAAGLAGIKYHEGEVRTVYLDPVGIPTVCVGHTATVTRADVGKRVSAQVCDNLLNRDTAEAQRAVGRLVKVPVTQGQYDALVSFTFNVGAGNLASSTLLRKLNAGDCHGAAAEFPRWNKAKGRVLPGLVSRRADERAVFEKGCQ
jgi:lysozyme